MNLFDIIGPVMVGPSSSHTAGAVRIGIISRKLMHEKIVDARILLHGSFASTGTGHGTKQALVAGLLNMQTDDERIPDSLEFAAREGMRVEFGTIELRDAHPNSVKLILKGETGKDLEIIGESLGGGRINIAKIDGLTANVAGDYPTLIVHNLDQPGHVAGVTAMLAHKSVNIAELRLYRDGRGGMAVMVVECDQEIPEESIKWLEKQEGIVKVTYLSLA